MQLKPITVIVVLLLVVASLLVSGCTSSNTSATNQPSSAATSAATHNATLEKYLAAQKNVSYADKNEYVKAFEVTWANSTSARVEWVVFNKTTNITWSYVRTFIVFPTTQDATDYLNAMNKTAYSLYGTQYERGVYYNATGHDPQVYKTYRWNEGDASNLLGFTGHEISQIDNMIGIHTGKAMGGG